MLTRKNIYIPLIITIALFAMSYAYLFALVFFAGADYLLEVVRDIIHSESTDKSKISLWFNGTLSFVFILIYCFIKDTWLKIVSGFAVAFFMMPLYMTIIFPDDPERFRFIYFLPKFFRAPAVIFAFPGMVLLIIGFIKELRLRSKKSSGAGLPT